MNGAEVGAVVGALVGADVGGGCVVIGAVVGVAHAETTITNTIINETMINNLFLDIGDFSCLSSRKDWLVFMGNL